MRFFGANLFAFFVTGEKFAPTAKNLSQKIE